MEELGTKKGFTIEKNNFHNISLGQGQEKVAEDAIDLSSQMGHWVMLQVSIYNIMYVTVRTFLRFFVIINVFTALFKMFIPLINRRYDHRNFTKSFFEYLNYFVTLNVNSIFNTKYDMNSFKFFFKIQKSPNMTVQTYQYVPVKHTLCIRLGQFIKHIL